MKSAIKHETAMFLKFDLIQYFYTKQKGLFKKIIFISNMDCIIVF